jgi:hypothetical protein
MDTTLQRPYLNNVLASHLRHQDINFLHDHAFHACLSEAEIPQIPYDKATQFMPVRTISEYHTYNRNREITL